MNKAEIISLEELYKSMLKCQQNVMWKPSVSSFSLNWLERLSMLEDELNNGTYKGKKPKPVYITYPKFRECLCIPFRDRVYQRSLNDNALYPMITKSFIYDNAACQRGKGTDFAVNRLKKFMWNFYCNHGNNGYVLHIDIRHYYPTMRHDIAKAEFAKHVPQEIMGMAATVLDSQYSGEVGYNPGSQMVQIAGVATLNPLDHYCKERLHIKHYLRYMDDFIIIHESKEQLEKWLEIIQGKLADIGFEIHNDKTQIFSLRQGFVFLGFKFRLSGTGKVLMFIDGQNVKHEKRKLARLVKLAKAGKISKCKVYECFNSWLKSHASRGTTYKVRQRMQQYFKNLWGEKS